jgi:hypothetical protein
MNESDKQLTNTLWTFGDSFTEYYDPKYDWSDKYIKFKGYKPKVYGEIIAEELGYKLINQGLGGSSNHTILERICNSIDEIQPNDLVIIGWSSTSRIRVIDDQGNWIDIISNTLDNLPKIGNITPEAFVSIFENRHHLKYCEEVNSWIKLINKSLTNGQVIHWKYFYEKINAHSFGNMQNIHTDTKGLIHDGHFSEKGQLDVAKELIKIFKSGEKS